LLKQIKTKVNKVFLIVTKAEEKDIIELNEEIGKTGLELAGVIPYDPLITEYDIKGKSLFELPDDSKAVQAVSEILKRIKL